MITQNVAINTVLQSIVDDDKRGRIMSIYNMLFTGVVPIGNLFIGIVATEIGPSTTFVISGTICFIGAIIYAKKILSLNHIFNSVYQKHGMGLPESITEF